MSSLHRARRRRAGPMLFGMREAVGMGLAAIRAYKMRAGLTILGVVMGIMTVTGMSSIVAGLNASMATQIEGLGSVGRSSSGPSAPGENLTDEEWRRRKGLTDDEVEAIAERCPPVQAIAPMELARASRRSSTATSSVQDAQRPRHHRGLRDRPRHLRREGPLPHRDATSSRGAPVAVIGTEVADALFPFVDPVDKEIPIDGRRFRVIGVMERRGSSCSSTATTSSWSRWARSQKQDPRFNFMVADVKPVSPRQMDAAIEEMREIAAPPAQAEVPAEGQLHDLHPGHPHRPLPPDHRRHLPGDDRDLLDRPAWWAAWA